MGGFVAEGSVCPPVLGNHVTGESIDPDLVVHVIGGGAVASVRDLGVLGVELFKTHVAEHPPGVILLVIEVAHDEYLFPFVDEVGDIGIVTIAERLEFGVPLEKDDKNSITYEFGHALCVYTMSVCGYFGKEAATTRRSSMNVFMTLMLMGKTCSGAGFVGETIDVEFPPVPVLV